MQFVFRKILSFTKNTMSFVFLDFFLLNVVS